MYTVNVCTLSSYSQTIRRTIPLTRSRLLILMYFTYTFIYSSVLPLVPVYVLLHLHTRLLVLFTFIPPYIPASSSVLLNLQMLMHLPEYLFTSIFTVCILPLVPVHSLPQFLCSNTLLLIPPPPNSCAHLQFTLPVYILLLYRWESILAVSRLPQTQNDVVKYYVLQFTCKTWNF
jgi:hypothetical protein